MKTSILLCLLLGTVSSYANVTERDFRRFVTCEMIGNFKDKTMTLYTNATGTPLVYDTVVTFQDGAWTGTSSWHHNRIDYTFETSEVKVNLRGGPDDYGVDHYQAFFLNKRNKRRVYGNCQ